MSDFVTRGFNPGKGADQYKSAVGTYGISLNARFLDQPKMVLKDESTG